MNDGYDLELKKAYDAAYSQGHRSEQPNGKDVVRYSDIHLRHRVLEMGCGGGDLVPDVLGNSKDAIFCDFSLNGLRYIKERFGAHVIQADCTKLPFRDEIFDRVITKDTIHAIRTERDRQYFMNEAARMTKKGGLVVFSMVQRKYGVMFRIAPIPSAKILFRDQKWGPFRHYYTLREFRDNLSRCNLRIIHVKKSFQRKLANEWYAERVEEAKMKWWYIKRMPCRLILGLLYMLNFLIYLWPTPFTALIDIKSVKIE